MDTAVFDVRLEVYEDLDSDTADFETARRAVDYIGCFVKRDMCALHVPRPRDSFALDWVHPKRPVVAVEHHTSALWSSDDEADVVQPRAVVVVRAPWLGDAMLKNLPADDWVWVPAEAIAW
jgi:hypothetical protein